MTALYIHIPFCKKKCGYCDFVSYAGKDELIDKYVAALCDEIKELAAGNWQLATIFLGGGTPTLLAPRHFDNILSLLIMITNINNEIEITTEANPGTANLAKLKALRELGINRLSIGAQSFNDQHLKTLGRIHNAQDIIVMYEHARKAGFDNINLDLIFALPNQTLDEWQSDLQTAINLNPNHLSTYNLQIEEGTPLCKQLPTSNLKLPTEEEDLAMYEYTIETLQANGYKHYEISNFAKPGFECQHNINYWKNGNYLGIGAGAHSHVNGKRWANPDSIGEYLNSVMVTKPVSLFGNGYGRITKNATETGVVTDRRETLFLGLRLLDGLEIDKFSGFEKEVEELIRDGLLMRENNHYKLTRKGLYLGNLVFEKFV